LNDFVFTGLAIDKYDDRQAKNRLSSAEPVLSFLRLFSFFLLIYDKGCCCLSE